jgi:hypothetical protein
MKPDADGGACPGDARLDAFARRALEPDEARAVLDHVRDCACCRAALADYEEGERYGELLREWRGTVPPAQRRRVIQTATEICEQRPSDERGAQDTGTARP